MLEGGRKIGSISLETYSEILRDLRRPEILIRSGKMCKMGELWFSIETKLFSTVTALVLVYKTNLHLA